MLVRQGGLLLPYLTLCVLFYTVFSDGQRIHRKRRDTKNDDSDFADVEAALIELEKEWEAEDATTSLPAVPATANPAIKQTVNTTTLLDNVTAVAHPTVEPVNSSPDSDRPIFDKDRRWYEGVGPFSLTPSALTRSSNNCTNSTLKCDNGGYLDESCTCRCADLFMGETCKDLYKPGAEPVHWPRGFYGIPQTDDACPSGVWSMGSRSHVTKTTEQDIGDRQNIEDDDSGELDGDLVVDKFCIRSEEDLESTGGDWPPGTYCIYQHGETCPTGFGSGWVLFDDNRAETEHTQIDGAQPRADYSRGTMYYYCCRKDGPVDSQIHLPRQENFQLFRYGQYCQQVKGMLVRSHYVKYEDEIPRSRAPHPLRRSPAGYSEIALCNYKALNYDCGGIYELNNVNSTIEITSPHYPQHYDNLRECIWYLKGPQGRYMTVEFDTFDVEEDRKGCLDSLEVRDLDLHQPGERYCGKRLDRTLILSEGFVAIVLHTNVNGTRPGFNLTARLVDDSEQSFNTEDRGTSYRGTVDRTERYTKCLPWQEVRYCSVNPFLYRYINSGLVGHNYCRNPNTLFRPWCYISRDCVYDYCDASHIGALHDVYNDCGELVDYDRGFCNTEEAATNCRYTCDKGQTRGNSTRVKQYCERPQIKDKNAAIGPAQVNQTTFAVGEKLKLVCKDLVDGATVSSELTCTTEGTFSGQQLFCSVSCPDGWRRYKDNCYKYVSTTLCHSEAEDACGAENSYLTSVSNVEENRFIKSLLKGPVWLGLADSEGLGKWRWLDGTSTSYTNYRPNVTDDISQRCVVMSADGLWNYSYCNVHQDQGFVCKKRHNDYDKEYYCMDEEPNCVKIVGDTYKMCVDHRSYAMAYCRKTCGFCSDLKCENPGDVENAESTTTDPQVDIGSYFLYTCKAGYRLQSGNLGRACVVNNTDSATITGSSPVCRPASEFSETYGQPVTRRFSEDEVQKLTVYDSEESNIQRNGQAFQWHVYSSIRTSLYALVWRRIDPAENTTFTLVGRSLLPLHAGRVNTITLKQGERFSVRSGDLLGWYTPGGEQGPVYTDCEEDVEGHGLRRMVYREGEVGLDYVNQRLQRKMTVGSTCRTYSIALTVAPGAPDVYSNVAATTRGGQCTTPLSKADCTLVIDGGITPGDSTWRIDTEGPQASLSLSFRTVYNLTMARFMQNPAMTRQIENVTLTFKDGSKQQVRLSMRHGSGTRDLSALSWDTFTLTPVLTDTVTVTVDSVYNTEHSVSSRDHYGFVEVEMYAACEEGWTHHGSKCYKVEDQAKTAADAEAHCVTKHKAHLTDITSSDQNSFIAGFASLHADVWIGLRTEDSERVWTWRNSSTSANYKNWEEGQPGTDYTKDCALMKPATGFWTTVNCKEYLLPFVCDRPVDRVVKVSDTHYGNDIQDGEKTDESYQQGYIFMEDSLSDDNPGGSKLKVKETGYIKAWELFSKKEYHIKMMVFRKTSLYHYTLVGENFLNLQANTKVYEVPEFDRIKVEKEDVIAWYYMPGQDPAIPYTQVDDCNVQIKHTRHPQYKPLTTNQALMFDNYEICATYSIAYILTQDEPVYENVAALTSLADCTHASSEQALCGLPFDGKLVDWASAWIVNTSETQESPTMTLELAETYPLVGWKVMQRLANAPQIQTLTLQCENGVNTQIGLTQRPADGSTMYQSQMWDVGSFDSPMKCKTVNVTLTEYTPGQIGLIELQLYAKGCPIDWTRYQNGCYKVDESLQSFEAANKALAAEGAFISTVNDKEEADHILSLSNGRAVYLGYTLINGKWEASDGSPMTYTNWVNEETRKSQEKSCVALRTDGKMEPVHCDGSSAESPKTCVGKKVVKANVQRDEVVMGNDAIPRRFTDKEPGYFYIEKSEKLTIKYSGYITKWILYSETSCNVMMMAFRRVDNSHKYTIVGRNLIRTPAGKTDIIAVPRFNQIEVREGDIVAWYYLPGCQPSLRFDTCSGGGNVMERRHPGHVPAHVEDGYKIRLKDTTATYQCRTYSVGYALKKITKDNRKHYNVAQGARCSASSSSGISSLAVDGSQFSYDSAWVSKQREGAWLKMNIKRKLSLHGLCVTSRISSMAAIRDLEVDISNNGKVAKQKVFYRFNSEMKSLFTDEVKLTVISMYGDDPQSHDEKYHAGLIEVQAFSEGCEEGWTKFQEICYFHDKEETLTWEDAVQKAASLGATLPMIKSADQNTYVQSIAEDTGDTFVGIHRNSIIAYVDGTDVTDSDYTNWENEATLDYRECTRLNLQTGQWERQHCEEGKLNAVYQKDPYREGGKMRCVGGKVEPRRFRADSSEAQVFENPSYTFRKKMRIVGWKVIAMNRDPKCTAKKESTMLASIWRPNESGNFTLLGSTALNLCDDQRVRLIQCPRAFQHVADQNDMIGVNFLPGVAGLMYDKDLDMRYKMWEREDGLCDPEDGQCDPKPGKGFAFSQVPQGRSYSISAVIAREEEPLRLSNIAHKGLVKRCEASDDADASSNVLEGSTTRTLKSAWTIQSLPAVGKWISLTFYESYRVQYIRIKQKYDTEGQIRTMMMSFSSGTPQKIKLKRTQLSSSDPKNEFWNDIEIKERDTTFINFTIDSTYDQNVGGAGLIEIRVLVECPSGYSRYEDHCYRLGTEKLNYTEASKTCAAQNARLVRIDDEDENGFLQGLIGEGRPWIGLYENTEDITNVVWQWDGDTQPYNYTNWAAGGSPGQQTGQQNRCAYLQGDGQWELDNCTQTRSHTYICEKAAPRVSPESVKGPQGDNAEMSSGAADDTKNEPPSGDDTNIEAPPGDNTNMEASSGDDTKIEASDVDTNPLSNNLAKCAELVSWEKSKMERVSDVKALKARKPSHDKEFENDEPSQGEYKKKQEMENGSPVSGRLQRLRERVGQ